jgi:hypothetical protein
MTIISNTNNKNNNDNNDNGGLAAWPSTSSIVEGIMCDKFIGLRTNNVQDEDLTKWP